MFYFKLNHHTLLFCILCLKINTLTITILAKSFIIIDYLILQSDNEDAYVEDRHQIAKERTQRTHSPITVGGLDMRRTSIKAECLTLIPELDTLGSSMMKKHQE